MTSFVEDCLGFSQKDVDNHSLLSVFPCRSPYPRYTSKKPWESGDGSENPSLNISRDKSEKLSKSSVTSWSKITLYAQLWRHKLSTTPYKSPGPMHTGYIQICRTQKPSIPTSRYLTKIVLKGETLMPRIYEPTKQLISDLATWFIYFP